MDANPGGAFVVYAVPGVTPAKWERIWRERMRRSPLELRFAPQPEALEALETGSAAMAFLRDVPASESRHVIPLYDETPVVVVPKDHLFSVVESVTEADLAGETVHPGQDADTLALVAAGVGVARMPQPVARAHSRRDLVARQVMDAEHTRIGLAWRVPAPGAAPDPRIDAFIGVVRGRTANSSRR